jgi:hypothetical protein
LRTTFTRSSVPWTLRDHETKQVEFVRASGVHSERLYVYDGASINWSRWRGYDPAFLRQNDSLGTESNPKVWVMREFKNSKDNGLGNALPKRDAFDSTSATKMDNLNSSARTISIIRRKTRQSASTWATPSTSSVNASGPPSR